MNSRFSIFSTLIEALSAAWQHPRIIFSFALWIAIVTSAQPYFLQYYPRPPTHYAHTDRNTDVSKNLDAELNAMTADISASERYLQITAIFGLFMGGVEIVQGALVNASILGVLKPNSAGLSTWRAINESVRLFAWRLVLLSLLIALIAVAIFVPFEILMLTVRAKYIHLIPYFGDFFVALTAIIFLVLIKYALAYPLVIVENLGAVAALSRSWHMTRGRFGYVMGCYVLVGTIEYLLSWALQLFHTTEHFSWADFSSDFIGGLFSCYWIVLAWVMYLRIKGAELRSS